MNVSMYEAQADTISVDDIVTNSNNSIVLSRIKRNNANDTNNELYIHLCRTLWVQNEHEEDGEDCIDYVPEGAYDMGWLGHFVGKNEHLERLYMRPFTPTSGASVRDVMEPFLEGLSATNQSGK